MPDDGWPVVNLASPRQAELSGPVGRQLQRGIDRLAQPPYTTDWLLADVSFKLNRAFTNYSGDVSGRFLELAGLTNPPGHYNPTNAPDTTSSAAITLRPSRLSGGAPCNLPARNAGRASRRLAIPPPALR